MGDFSIPLSEQVNQADQKYDKIYIILCLYSDDDKIFKHIWDSLTNYAVGNNKKPSINLKGNKPAKINSEMLKDYSR